MFRIIQYLCFISLLTLVGSGAYGNPDWKTPPPNPNCLEIDRAILLFASDTSVEFAIVGMSDSVRVEYGISGFPQGNGTFLKTDEDTFVIGGLIANTVYEFYFENNCKGSGNGVSNWSPVYEFKTSQRVNLPHFENFDIDFGLLEERHYGDSAAPAVHTAKWRVSSTVNTITCGAFQHLNNTDFAALDGQFGTSVTGFKESFLTSPIYDTTGFKEELFAEWDEHCDGCAFAKFQVYDGTEWVNVPITHSVTNWDICNRNGLGAGTPAHKAYDITQYANANLKIRFVAENSSSPIDLGKFWVVDDFQIRTVDCLESSNYIIDEAGPDWVDLKWDRGTAIGFKIEYGPSGFTPGTGTVVHTLVDSIHIGSLNPNTHYEFLLTDSCMNGVSLTQEIDTVDYITADTIQSTPFYADFPVDQNGFSILDNTPESSGWTWNNARMEVSNPLWHFGGSSSEYLFSPPVLTGVPPIGGALIIEYGVLQSDIIFPQTGKLYVQVYDGFVWQDIQTHQGPYFNIGPSGLVPVFQSIRVPNMTHPITRLRFRADWNENDDLAMTWIIDSVRIFGDCGDTISNVITTYLGTNDAAFSWSTTGHLVNLTWGPTGFDPELTGSLAKAISVTSDTIQGLSPQTCYDLYVQDTCVGYGRGEWIGPLPFCTDTLDCVLPQGPLDTLTSCNSISLVQLSSPEVDTVLIEYGLLTFAPGTGTSISFPSGDTLILNGLTHNTLYDIYIANICGTDTSDNIGPFTVMTDLDSSTAAFTHNFNSPFGITLTSTGHRPGDTLRWDFGDGNTDTGAVVTHTYTVAGTYTIRLILSNGCQTDTATLFIPNIGLEEKGPIKTFEVYPNPARDELTIVVNLREGANMEIDIFDINGRSAFHKAFESADGLRQKLYVEAWPRGMYSLRIRTNGSVIRSKITLY